MQVKRFLFSLGFVLLFLGANSQNGFPQWVMKFNVTDIVPLKMPRIGGGVECVLGQHSISAEYGFQYKFDQNKQPDSNFVRPNGHSLALEYRYYYNDGVYKQRYFGIQVFGKQQLFNEELCYYKRGDTSYFRDGYNDAFTVKKERVGFYFVLGEKYESDRFSVEIYTGYGFSYRRVVNTHRSLYLEDGYEVPFSAQLFQRDNNISENNGWGQVFMMGARIGIALN
jgi:hypothetical protein